MRKSYLIYFCFIVYPSCFFQKILLLDVLEMVSQFPATMKPGEFAELVDNRLQMFIFDNHDIFSLKEKHLMASIIIKAHNEPTRQQNISDCVSHI